jgi:tetraacyldisaccharide 4'-kinase
MLREARKGVKRADMIIITKCPKDLSEIAQEEIRTKIGGNQSIFFTFIDYDVSIFSDSSKLDLSTIRETKKIVVAGIAKPKPFYDFLKADDSNTITFPDHHEFSDADIQTIKNKAKNDIIITTEKDFVRLNDKLQSDTFVYVFYYLLFVTILVDMNCRLYCSNRFSQAPPH